MDRTGPRQSLRLALSATHTKCGNGSKNRRKHVGKSLLFPAKETKARIHNHSVQRRAFLRRNTQKRDPSPAKSGVRVKPRPPASTLILGVTHYDSSWTSPTSKDAPSAVTGRVHAFANTLPAPPASEVASSKIAISPAGALPSDTAGWYEPPDNAL